MDRIERIKLLCAPAPQVDKLCEDLHNKPIVTGPYNTGNSDAAVLEKIMEDVLSIYEQRKNCDHTYGEWFWFEESRLVCGKKHLEAHVEAFGEGKQINAFNYCPECGQALK